MNRSSKEQCLFECIFCNIVIYVLGKLKQKKKKYLILNASVHVIYMFLHSPLDIAMNECRWARMQVLNSFGNAQQHIYTLWPTEGVTVLKETSITNRCTNMIILSSLTHAVTNPNGCFGGSLTYKCIMTRYKNDKKPH